MSAFLGNKDIWIRKSEFVADLIPLIENYAKSREKKIMTYDTIDFTNMEGISFIPPTFSA